jgi:dTDP-glucose 4,6-dehydratase
MRPADTDNPLAGDLDHVLKQTERLWEELRGGRVFITGGVGFVGRWLLESFVWAHDELGLNASAVVLTRDAAAAARQAPRLADHPAVRFQEGDMRTFGFPDGAFTHVVHAATQTVISRDALDPLAKFDSDLEGTRRVLELARSRHARRFLFTSSGAVYGRQPPELTHLPEDFSGAPDALDPDSAYAQGKRASEFACAAYCQQYGLEAVVARGFAFVGPHLPLDAGYAIGNFVRDAQRGGPISVYGDGTPYRSYLYAADLAIWLWTLLIRGQPCRAYNVGSDVDMTIAELALVVARILAPGADIRIHTPPLAAQPAERYVPSIDRARTELGLRPIVPLDDALRRTSAWLSRTGEAKT